MSNRKLYSFFPILFLIMLIPTVSNSQIVESVGNPADQASQLIFYYDNTDGDDTVIQVTNTNDTTGVWVHVQVFRSFDPDEPGTGADPVICDERDFIDFFTPNDTHIYDLDDDNFHKNIGEDETTAGEMVTFDSDDTVGFVVVTPVVSEADLSAIAFKYMIGQSLDDDEDLALNAMGRDALDFATGDLVADGTVLDGTSNGYVVLQPEEVLFQFQTDGNDDDDQSDVIGIVFSDSYGEPGLLGYQVLAASATWTSFIFDFKEDPTSCGTQQVECFLNLGINDNVGQDEGELNPGDALLCGGTETPVYADPNTPGGFEFEVFGWGRIFVSNLEGFENFLGVIKNDDVDAADWMYTKP